MEIKSLLKTAGKTTVKIVKTCWKPFVTGVALGIAAVKTVDVIIDKDETASEPELLEPNEEAALIADVDSAVEETDNNDEPTTPEEE